MTPLNICLAGEGAIARSHMTALQQIEGVKVTALAGGIEGPARDFAKEFAIPYVSLDLGECLARPDVDAVILATPTPLHPSQVERSVAAGKHVLVEIPMAVSAEDSRRLADLEKSSGLVCMVAHSRRYAPAHREMRRRILAGEFHLQHLVIETYFLRRTNLNALGQPRTWTDNLLWHHACHAVDLAYWLTDDPSMKVWGQAGPKHPQLGIAMDMTIGMRAKNGALISVVMSFNNDGPFGGFHRYIGEEGTFHAYREGLEDAKRQPIALEGNSFLDQNREFVAAIRESRPAMTSLSACLPSMVLLDRIEQAMGSPQ